MSTPTVKFNREDNPEFFKVLNQRVNQYFKDKDISKHGNPAMWFKTAFMLCLYLVPFILMVTGVVSGTWPILGIWVLMASGMSGIGLAVMHDANHRAYSQSPRVNKIVGNSLALAGGYPANWRMQHNVLHHSFTNIEDHDEDFDTPILRCSPNQERKGIHSFQAFYAPLVYGLMTIYWLIGKDFVQLNRYDKMGLLAGQKLTYRRAFWEIVLLKLTYVSIFLVLPILVVNLPWWEILLGFLLMQYLSGLVLALVFQPAHVIQETDFYKADEGSVENSWAIHQLRTTSNFGNRSRLLTWYVGGLNHQVEHHLYPNICHVHYRHLAPIVKATATEFGVPYYAHKTFYAALKSHFTLLHRLGTGKYDREAEMSIA